jgi:hypothetical protein
LTAWQRNRLRGSAAGFRWVRVAAEQADADEYREADQRGTTIAATASTVRRLLRTCGAAADGVCVAAITSVGVATAWVGPAASAASVLSWLPSAAAKSVHVA